MRAVDLDPQTCERARRARDLRFDGRFFVAVLTTGIYCRPICPAPLAREHNVRYLPSAAAAEAAGFRPCLRCRPEAAPGTPAWHGTGATVARALRLIDGGAFEEVDTEGLARRLGVGGRHLRRLFEQHVGASPKAVAATRRVQLAKRLLDETDWSIAAVAAAAGFGSVRRFNEVVRAVYGRAPRELRRSTDPVSARSTVLRVPVREPFDHEGLLAFLGARAVAGVEHLESSAWSRTFREHGVVGSVRVTRAPGAAALAVEIDVAEPRVVAGIVARVRRVFDTAADPVAIESVLGRDAALGPLCRGFPGVRVPGAWDGFEVAVRAVLGQQVTVRAATTLCGRLVARCGDPLPAGAGFTFPTPQQIAATDLDGLGLTGARSRTLHALAGAVAERRLDLSGAQPVEQVRATLLSLPGIGRWTAEYVVMRAFGEPDAFPSGDLVLRRMLGLDERALTERAEEWRPWRAYAAMLLWRSAAERRDGSNQPCSTPSARALSASS